MKGRKEFAHPSAVDIASGFGTFFISFSNKTHPDHPGVSCIFYWCILAVLCNCNEVIDAWQLYCSWSLEVLQCLLVFLTQSLLLLFISDCSWHNSHPWRNKCYISELVKHKGGRIWETWGMLHPVPYQGDYRLGRVWMWRFTSWQMQSMRNCPFDHSLIRSLWAF